MNSKHFLSALFLASTLLSSGSARADGIGPVDCKNWYKDPFVAVICGFGAVFQAPIDLMEYLDKKELKNIGITREEHGDHNKYQFNKENLNFAVFSLRRDTLSEAQKDCASIDGRLATSSEIEIISKGGRADADILFGTVLINRNLKGTMTESFLTGWVSDQGEKDVFLLDQKTKQVKYFSHQDVVERLNQSEGNEYRTNFDHRGGILTPVCITK